MRFRIVHLLLLMTVLAIGLTIGVPFSRLHRITKLVIVFLLLLYVALAWLLFFVSVHGRR
jgi:hypothetical protein